MRKPVVLWGDFFAAVVIVAALLLLFHALAPAQGPVSRNLAWLRAAVRYQIRAQTTSGVVTDTLLDYAINRAIGRVCASLPAIVKFDTVMISEDNEGAALNTDFDRIKAVYHMGGDSVRVPLIYIGEDTLAAKTGTIQKSLQVDKNDPNSLQYCWTGGARLFIQPKPSRPATDPDSFFVEYYAQGAKLSAATDSTAIQYRYIEKVVLYAAVMVSGTRSNYADGYFYWSLFREDLSGYRALEQIQTGAGR